jgi:hypothetical protein
MDEKLKNAIKMVVKEQLEAMYNMVVPFHTHNSWDNPQLDPKIALLGFPVEQVSDARVAPTDTPLNGQFRFQVDTTPRYRLWAYLSTEIEAVITSSWQMIPLSLATNLYQSVSTLTNGTNSVNVFSATVPFSGTVTGIYLISNDTTAGDITIASSVGTIATIAKGTVAGVMVGATSLSNTTFSKGNTFTVVSSSTGNAFVIINFIPN